MTCLKKSNQNSLAEARLVRNDHMRENLELLPLARLEEWCTDLKKAADKAYSGDLSDLRQETHAICDSILRHARMCVIHQDANRWVAFTLEELMMIVPGTIAPQEMMRAFWKEIESELARREREKK
jgi:hypothetical protein